MEQPNKHKHYACGWGAADAGPAWPGGHDASGEVRFVALKFAEDEVADGCSSRRRTAMSSSFDAVRRGQHGRTVLDFVRADGDERRLRRPTPQLQVPLVARPRNQY